MPVHLSKVVLCVVAIVSMPRPARAEPRDHVGGGAGGAVAGLICGGATLTYSKLRGGANGPVLWHGDSAGWIGVFFAEHAAVGGLSGALGDGPRQGFVVGGAVTCGLDIVYVVASELIAATDDEPSMALLEISPDGTRWGAPPVAVGPDGAWISLFAWEF